ncbi:MAG: serine/threonine-protein kinase [Planctomycetota bacterium]|jgi:hypothetical protein
MSGGGSYHNGPPGYGSTPPGHGSAGGHGNPFSDFGQHHGLSAGAGPTGAAGAYGSVHAVTDGYARQLQPGTVLSDRYIVRRLLGQGGMGAVYQAQDRLRNRDVAIKVMLPSVLSLPKAVVRFQNEAELMMGLTHDGVVNVHDVGLDPTTGIRFFTMELLRGQSLRAWLEAKKDAHEKVSLEDALEIARQLCEALRYAHRKTVHRDLKPENIFLVEGEKIHLKVLDFGIAKVQSQSAFTRTNVSLGTVDYMAPEQRQDAASVDERADIYSVCVILYEMLTGVLPIGRYSTPAEERPGLPRAIDEVVLTGLDRRPERRHPTAESLLAQVLAVGKRARGGGSRRSRKGLAIVGVLLLLGLGAAGAWRAGLFSGWTSTEPGGGAGSVVPLSFAELEPANGASLVLDAATLTIKGRLSDPSAGPIWVGEPGKTGIEKGVDKEGRFTAHPGLDPAATTIEIRAGQPPRQITARVAVTIDTAPPVVTFVDPPEWAGGPLQVAVKVDDANPRRVHFRLEAGGRTVGTPVEAAVPASGLAKATLSVPAGVTGLAVIAEAEDVVGRKGHARSVVAFDRTPPRIQILGPADGLVTKARFVKVSARIEGSRGSVQARVVAPGAVLPVRESALVEGMLGPLRLSLPRDDGWCRESGTGDGESDRRSQPAPAACRGSCRADSTRRRGGRGHDSAHGAAGVSGGRSRGVDPRRPRVRPFHGKGPGRGGGESHLDRRGEGRRGQRGYGDRQRCSPAASGARGGGARRQDADRGHARRIGVGRGAHRGRPGEEVLDPSSR